MPSAMSVRTGCGGSLVKMMSACSYQAGSRTLSWNPVSDSFFILRLYTMSDRATKFRVPIFVEEETCHLINF